MALEAIKVITGVGTPPFLDLSGIVIASVANGSTFLFLRVRALKE